MKLKGQKLEPPKPIDVILREGEDLLHFKVRAILDYDEFDKLCPFPQPPMITRPGKKAEPDETDSKFRQAKIDHWNKRRGWTYLKSFEASEGLEWETMSLSDPTTWGHDKFIQELKSSGFTIVEIGHLIREVERANSMDEKHMEEVRSHFLQQEAARKLSK